jgi:hypothetical protein
MTGAESRTRTGTGKSPKDFKSFASTNSAIPATLLEAAPGFEPGVRDLQSLALPLGYAAPFFSFAIPIFWASSSTEIIGISEAASNGVGEQPLFKYGWV